MKIIIIIVIQSEANRCHFAAYFTYFEFPSKSNRPILQLVFFFRNNFGNLKNYQCKIFSDNISAMFNVYKKFDTVHNYR